MKIMKNLIGSQLLAAKSVIPFIICLNNIFGLQWIALASGQTTTIPVKVGLVLDKETMEGKMGLSCINMALSDVYAAHPEFRTRVDLHVRDYQNNDVVNAAAAVVDLIKNEQVAAIIGPKTSEEAHFIINLGERSNVPIVSYSATSPFLSPSKNHYFVRATQDDSSQVQPLTDFIQAFGWRNVVPIYVDDDFGGGIVSFLADSLQKVGTSIPYRSAIPSSASKYQIQAELYKLKSLSTRVFIVHMAVSLGSQLFEAAEELGMMSPDYVWIITNAMADVLNNVKPRVIRAMEGVVGVETYVARTRELDDFSVRWKRKFQQENPNLSDTGLNVHGFWAYDAANALARALEQVNFTNFTFQRADNAPNANLSNDVSTMGVSNVGPQLRREILRTKFSGLSGNFDVSDGELKITTFRLINVWRGVVNGVGYWTPDSGLVQELHTAKSGNNVATLTELTKSIRWPGDPLSVPEGWVVSPNGKKLRIGVPIKDGFKQFVTVTRDTVTNKTHVTGFCIEVFNEVMAKLPYSVRYRFIPYTDHEGQPTESYNKLVNQVYLKKFDAVVGDVTIRADRAKDVDFTLPFTESGVVMIAPVKDNKKLRAWLFVKPLTWDLWLSIFCFFIFIAFVVWVLEHRINEDFRGPPRHQAGTSLYYSFSTMVFSHSFSVFNNLTRFVVIIWVFVLLLLTQSYAASLASLLTVAQLQPTITDVNELITKGYKVGYQEGSFVYDLLIEKKFDKTNLTPYNTSQQLHDLLGKGTSNGGIAAAFDEIPFLKIFMVEYCNKYTMIQPTYKADGFGFAFPRGSPLVSDVSRMVLKVTEGQKMTELEKTWLQTGDCPNSTSVTESSSLGLESFWGLFMIAGAASIVALVVYLVGFMREHRSVWSDSDVSVWTRIRTLIRILDQKNLNSHTFRKTQLGDPSFAGTTPNTPCPDQSPTGYWGNSDAGFSRHDGQSVPNSGNLDPDIVTLQAPPVVAASMNVQDQDVPTPRINP